VARAARLTAGYAFAPYGVKAQLINHLHVVADYEKISAQYGRIFLWTTLTFYAPFLLLGSTLAKTYLEQVAGSFDAISKAPVKIKA
jgi:hypothetical protein